VIDQNRIQQAIDTIEEAFRDTVHPEPASLIRPEWQDDERGLDVVQKFDAPTREAVSEHSELPRLITYIFSPEAWKYYLPAFMLVALRSTENQSRARCMVGFALNPPEEARWFQEEYGAYSDAQKHAIRRYFEIIRDKMVDVGDGLIAADALARYWAKGTGGPLSPLHEKRRILKSVIRTAFADAEYPGDDNIGKTASYAGDGEELNHDLRGFHWLEVPRPLLAYHAWDLPFFTLEGLRFYLPTYLLAALDQFGDVTDTVIYQVTNAEVVADVEKNRTFTPSQINAICLFLEYVREERLGDSVAIHACIALDFYWRSDVHLPHPPPPMDHARKEQVLFAINNGFAGFPYPGDDNIRWHVFDHVIASDEQAQTFVDDFRGYPSGDVPLEILEKHIQSLRFSPQAWKFFFPAFLRSALDEAGQLVYWVISDLMPIDHFPTFWMQELDLTLAQRHAVVFFLEYVRDCMPHRSLAPAAQRALDLVWSDDAYQKGMAAQDG
jgi:hypothetical protein